MIRHDVFTIEEDDYSIDFHYEYSHEKEAWDRSTPEYKDVNINQVVIHINGTTTDITSFAFTQLEDMLDEINEKIIEKYED